MRPFFQRVVMESALLSLATGLLTALPVWLAVAVLERATGACGKVLMFMPLLAKVLAVLYFALLFRPTLKKTAARLDRAGLLDAASTMVEFAGNDGLLYRLQREETAKQLEGVSPRAIPIHIPTKRLIACTVLACMIALVPVLPDSLFAWGGRAAGEREEIVMFRQSIAAQRERLLVSALNENARAEISAALDALDGQADEGIADLSALAEISRRLDEGATESSGPLNSYAEALLKCEKLRPVGEALQTENMAKISAALAEVENAVKVLSGNDRVNAIMDIVYEISSTLRHPVRDERDNRLAHAFTVFSGDLEGAASVTLEGRNSDLQIHRAFTALETRIAKFYTEDPEEQAEKKQENAGAGEPDNAHYSHWTAQPVQEEIKLIPAEVEQIYHPSDAALSSGYVPGMIKSDGTVDRIPAPKDASQDGTVPYGTVYGNYYAKYLEQVRQGQVPQELLDIMEQYFNGL